MGACIFRGFEDAYESVRGPLGAHREAFYAEGAIFSAMLQMPALQGHPLNTALRDVRRRLAAGRPLF